MSGHLGPRVTGKLRRGRPRAGLAAVAALAAAGAVMAVPGAAAAGTTTTALGSTAYVANSGADTVTPINTATNTPGALEAAATSPPSPSVPPTPHAGQRSGAAAVSAPAGAQSPTALTGPEVFGWGFDTPFPVATDGTDVWVANAAGDSVTELTASTGTFVQAFSGSAYDFDEADAVATDGTDVWVTNAAAQSVTGFPVA
jgi:DNA-binding beta-propeller fold protein YncE